ncbi:metallophosphoesterase family protein [Paenibacillus cremeus]|uniref:metallophosphoesterase family protein n=1 Tax=Paenibacillus cremeus TaxID=2163881 RepID=UPI0021BD06AA|nr:metallophosphoesterase [Paenibacillus cremeus]
MKDANKIIEAFLQPRWNFVTSPEEKDELHRLADELRKAAAPAPKLSFAVLSDIQYWDTKAAGKFSAALADLYRLNPELDDLVINGDLGDGRPEDYAKLGALVQNHPLADRIYYTIGNHEFYQAYYNSQGDWAPDSFPNGETDHASIARFLQFTGLSGLYYDRLIQGSFHVSGLRAI